MGHADAGEIALACALDYLIGTATELADHAANLQDWLGDFAAAVPGYRETFATCLGAIHRLGWADAGV